MRAGYVDLHHHLLYETDDGASGFEMSIQMLHRAADQGICAIAATPHILPGHYKFDLNLNRQKLETLKEYIEKKSLDILLYPGAEILYTSTTTILLQAGRLQPLGNSWHLLVEFNPGISFDAMKRAIHSVSNSGFGVVLAHTERYRCLRIGSRASKLRDRFDVKFQFNADAVLLAHRPFGDSWIRHMLRRDLVDIIASDAHNLEIRPCRLGDCADLLSDKYGSDRARRLCRETPLSILNERYSRSTNTILEDKQL